MMVENFEVPLLVCVRQRGIVTFRIAARAPWQQGRVERHGGLMKELIEKCRNELPPTSMTELVVIVRECECAKNRFSNRSGFSPMQRMTGQWPRMPGSLMSDEELDPALQAENHTDDFSRLMEARRVAQQAFNQAHQSDSSWKGVACKTKKASELQDRRLGIRLSSFEEAQECERSGPTWRSASRAQSKVGWSGLGVSN